MNLWHEHWLTAVLASGRAWRFGYAIVGGAQLVLGLCFAATRDRWRGAGDPSTVHDAVIVCGPLPLLLVCVGPFATAVEMATAATRQASRKRTLRLVIYFVSGRSSAFGHTTRALP